MTEASLGSMQPSSIPAPEPTGSGAVDEAVAIWRALAALGVRDVVLSPGSRSAPLVYALQDPQVAGVLRVHVRIDERAAAFTALGISRADPSRPGVVITTSGTAAAHLHAAVLEAHHGRIPLLVLTADRPAELRGVGANQAADQVGLYGSAVGFSADLPAPARTQASEVELRTAVSTLARAFAAAAAELPGPVHVNLGFRDPLVPAGGAVPGGGSEPADAPRIPLAHRPLPPALLAVPLALRSRTVVVAGDQAGRAARDFAEAHRLPLFAEPSSGARGGDCAIPGYPALLSAVMSAAADGDLAALRPELAIVFGHPTLSRAVLGSLLGAESTEIVIVDPAPGAAWADPSRRAHLIVPAITAATEADREDRAAYFEQWRHAARAAQQPRETEALPWQTRAALAVWDATGEADALVLGSSSLIRDLEQHAGDARGEILASRGLAGIDGLISTASGLALARAGAEAATPAGMSDPGRPGAAAAGRVRLLIGDVTALHDLTGLVVGPLEQEPALDIVVVDDGGGRIFSSLEHRQADPALLERCFTTPHGADLVAVARGLGVESLRVEGADALSRALADGTGGRRLLVVQDSSSAPERSSRAKEMQ